jgi:hypothetical protein
MIDNKVIDIYEWHRPLKPGEFPKVCAIPVEPTPTQPEKDERRRKMKPSELALAVTFAVLASLLIASYV